MSSTSRHPRNFLSPPRDYLHRRRYRRRLANFIGIPLLSIITAYAITRPTGGAAFHAPKSVQGASALSHLSSSAGTATTAAPGLPLLTPSIAAPASSAAYKLSDGPDAVTEVQDLAFHDAKRNKTLHVRVFYPAGQGPFPVIIFSHGAGGSQFCCDGLTRHWASYGYVTIQPTHADSTTRRRNAGEDVTFLKALREALKKPELWESRPGDISFALDSLGALQKAIPGLRGKLDANRIGVGGHSMGAFTADAVAGALVDLPERPAANFADPRVKAALLLSPQGPGEFGLTDHSWDRVSIPLMSVTGSLDTGANGAGPGWRRTPFDRSEPGDKYHVFIEGANHMSFITAKALLPGRTPQGQAIFDYTNCAALAFWDTYLKGDDNAKQYLQSDALSDYSHGAVTLSRR